MGERYRECPQCKGHGKIVRDGQIEECPRCEGTGFDGGIYEQ